MIDERQEAQASLYALGALSGEELRAFEDALRRDLELQLFVAELRAVADATVAALPRATPPPALKRKLFATLQQRSATETLFPISEPASAAWLTWMPWAMAAGFAILCLVLISIGNTLRQQAFALREQLEQSQEAAATQQHQLDTLQSQTTQLTSNYQQRLQASEQTALRRLNEIVRETTALTNQLQQQTAETRRQLARSLDQTQQLLREKKTLEETLAGAVASAPDRLAQTYVALLRPTPDGAPTTLAASVWSGQEQRGLLIVEGLPALPAAKTYQLWILDPKAPGPISAGVLPAHATGNFRFAFGSGARIEAAERFAISIEPKGGVPAPTGRIVLVSN